MYTANKNKLVKIDTGIVLRWRLVTEDYGPEIEYIQGKKIIVADSPSRFSNFGNQRTAQESSFTNDKMS